jgi:hypothetical protein
LPKIQGTSRTVQTNTARLTPPSTAGFGASGRATQQLGKTIAQAGNQIASTFGAIQEKNDALDTNMKLLEFSMDQDQKQFESGRSIDHDGRDHVNNSLARYDTESASVLQNIPEKQRRKAQYSMLRTRQRIQNESQRQQGQHQDTYWTSRGVEHSGNVVKTMVTPEALKKDGLNAGKGAIAVTDAAIDQMPISLAKKQAMKALNRKNVAKAIAEKIDPEQYRRMEAAKASTQKVLKTSSKLPSNSVGKALGAAAQKHGVSPDVIASITKIESNFNPRAKNPNSSARGLGQFINSTGRQYGLRNDGSDSVQAQSDALARFTKDNINNLKSSLKRDPTPGEIYLAHFAGVGRAKAIGRASDKTPISSVLGPKAIRANKSILQGKTVGQVKVWAARKMGASSGPVVSGDVFSDELFSEKNRKIVDSRWKKGIKEQVQTSMKGKPSVTLESNIDALHDVLEKDPKNEGIRLALKEAEKFKKDQSKALRADPIKYADDQGIVEAPSLIGQKDIVKGLSDRINTGDKIADVYQIETKYLRQEEKAFLSKQFHEMEAQDKLQFLSGIDKGAGPKAKKILSEMHDIDPGFSHVGGLYLIGRKEAAMLAMQGMEIMKDKSLKDITERIKGADVSAAYSNYFGNTFGTDSIKAAGPFLSSAKAIATTLMVQGKHENVSDALEEGMRRATGHTEVNGEQYGGVIEFNDQSLMVHPDHKASDYENLFEHITNGTTLEDDGYGTVKRSFFGDPRGAFDFFLKKDGVNPTNPTTQRPVTAEELHDAQFVSVGAGRVKILIDGLPLRDTRTAQNLGEGKQVFNDEYIMDVSEALEVVK